MTTLVITGNTNYQSAPNDALVNGQNITALQFSTTAPAVAEFLASQFVPGSLASNLSVTGNTSFRDEVVVLIGNAANFSAAAWTFSDWTGSDRVEFRMNGAGGQTVTGSSGRNTYSIGGGGADQITGGGSSDFFNFFSAISIRGASYDGAGGAFDAIELVGGHRIDFSLATLSRIEVLSLTEGLAVFRGDQFGGSNGISVLASDNATVVGELLVHGNQIDLSGLTVLSSWSGNANKRIELRGTINADTVTGSSAQETLLGSSGNDRLNGGGGNDRLFGDGLFTNTTNIAYTQPANGANTSNATATDITSFLTLFNNSDIADATTEPHATVVSGSRNSDRIEVFKITVDIGETILRVDIDQTGSGLDSYIEVYDADGALLAANDDASPADAGSATPLDSATSFGVPGPGTYFIHVGKAAGGVITPLDLNDTYTMHVSLIGAFVAGNDTLDGGAGNDTMTGRGGNDTYVVDSVADVVVELAGEGDDTLISFISMTLPDHVERMNLASGPTLNATGNGLANTITGNTNTNIIDGGAGADTLLGGQGNDTLIGGAGKDLMTGGGGLDHMRLTSLADSGVAFASRDVINTFAHGDKIDLSAIDARTNVAGDQAFTFIGAAAFSGVAGQLRFSMTNISVTGVKAYTVFGDVNGDSAADFSLQIYTSPTADRTGQPETWNLASWDFIL
jgi:Ca2+-binding RTX toxin-like protein